MKEISVQAKPPETSGEARNILLEGAVVAVAGLVFALAANGFSPRGLALTRDYFPGATPPLHSNSATASVAQVTAKNPAGTHASPEVLTERLKAKGLQWVDGNQAVKLFRDPRYAQELVVFVDARNDAEYQAGHVPGAYQLDHYRAENYLATVLPVCQTAEKIVVYCTGGDCEDSEFAATTLSLSGIPKTNLYVYAGGFSEWAAKGLPIERGARLSGNLINANP